MLPGLFSNNHNCSITLGTRWPLGLLPYRIPTSSITTHMYMCGRSNRGKSKLIEALFVQLCTKSTGKNGDIRHAVGLLDPHSDLANDALCSLYSFLDPAYMNTPFLKSQENLDRVVYVDPMRTDWVVPLNLFKNSYTTPHIIAQHFVNTYKRTFPDLGDAPVFSEILRNSVQALAECGMSLVEIVPFLTEEEFRVEVLSQNTDPLVWQFFHKQYGQWGGKDQLLRAASTLNKVSAFLFVPPLRYCLGADDNILDLRRCADEGRVVIIDLGGLEEESQRLLGSLLVISMEQAAKSRRTLPRHKRLPLYFFIDEFISFMSNDQETVARLLSEIRKFRFHLGLSHQTSSQLSSDRLRGAIENCEMKIVFGSGRQTAETIAEEVHFPDTFRVKHQVEDEAQRERSHPVFESLWEQSANAVTQIRRLQPRRILVQPAAEGPLVALRTPTVEDHGLSVPQLEKLKQYFLRRDGVPFAKIKRDVDERLQSAPKPKWTKAVFYEPPGEQP